MKPAISPAPLESILFTEELNRRPLRAADYATENRALVALAQALADAPQTILQALAEKILEVLKAGSAGVSLLAENEKSFFWPAIAGKWQTHVGGGTPRNFGPCGDVLDCNAPLLFKHIERRYTYFEPVTPPVEECLLVPFYVAGKAVGTIWAIAHDNVRKFDSEDLRQLENLGRFASAAYQAQTMGAREQRRAALKLEDAIQSGLALENLNLELRASEAFNRSIVESSLDCIKLLDLEGNLQSVLCGQAMLGIDDIQPFLNKSWFDFWDGEDRLAAQAAVAAAAAGATGRFVGFFSTLRGEPKWWDVAISPILDANGKPERLLSVSRDVTQRKHAEMNLAFLAAISHDLVLWTNVDEMMRVVAAKMAAYFNLSICAFVEIDEAAEQVVVSHDWHRDDVPGLVGVYRLADFVEEEFIRLARTGEPIVVRDTLRDTRTSNAKFAALKIASFICMPLIRNEQWRFALCLYRSAPYDWREDEIELTRELIARIWTRLERLRAEESLRVSEEQYRNLFNSMDEGLCVIEMIFDEHDKPVDYLFLDVNPSFVKHTGMDNAPGKRVRELVPDIEPYWVELYGKIALTGESVRYVNVVKGLGDRWLDVFAFRLAGPGSRKIAVLFTDITERSLLEKKTREQAEALADLNRRKDEFLAMLSHELRNPLAPISNALHLLRLQKDEAPIQQQARGIMERQVGQLTHLIDDLMEVSRITTGRIHLHQERLALAGIVEHAVETVRPLIDQRRHSLELSVPPEPIWLHADAARLEQVIVNLLTNAAKYTDEGGSIWLSIAQEGDEAVLRVKDTGIGISPELLPRIFDLFTQADRSLDRSQGGLGIGLCLVQRLVEMHRGTVEAYSTLSKGSEFVVRLPVVHNSALSPAASMAKPQPSGDCLRVLVVEDNVDAAETLTMLLELSGHSVRTAHDGLTAVGAALDYRPHVVLLDIGLPGMDGFEVAKRLRRQTALGNMVLVAMTGYGEVSARQRSRDAGFDHHLVKPADFGKLQEILAGVMDKAVRCP